MILMNLGDKFDQKYIYCSYYKDNSWGNPMTRIYIFRVKADGYVYKIDHSIIIYLFRYIYTPYDDDSDREFDSKIYTTKYPMKLYLRYEEIWQLTEDEALDILSEVI